MSRQAGSFLDAQTIRQRSPRVITDVLRDQPGISVITAGTGLYGGRLYFRALCAPSVYIDGVEVTRVGNRQTDQAMAETFEEINRLHPSSIELIEIYRGPAEVPAEFGGSSAMCGAIGHLVTP